VRTVVFKTETNQKLSPKHHVAGASEWLAVDYSPVAVLRWGQGGTGPPPPNLAQAPQIFSGLFSLTFPHVNRLR